MHIVPPDAAPGTAVFDGDGGSSMWPTVSHNAPLPIPTSFRITSVCTVEIVDPTQPLYTSTNMSRVITIHHLEVRVKLKTLNNRSLGGNLSILSLSKKKLGKVHLESFYNTI